MFLQNSSYQFSIIAVLLFLTTTLSAQSNTPNRPQPVLSGSLIMQLADATARHMPLIDTQVSIEVYGLVARTKVKQFFENPSFDTIEATYAFPLPEDSAVDYLKMTIGERQIIGQIKVKKEAKRIYEQARAAGKKAALMLQSRDNLFRTKVANINPGEVIEVHIEYAQKVQYKNGKFQLRFPSTITPRYEPKVSDTLIEEFNQPSRSNQTLPDASVKTQVVPKAIRPDHQLSIDVSLQPGFPLKMLDSANHAIVTSKSSTGAHQISLQKYLVTDRDFELSWQAEDSTSPRLITYHELAIEQDGDVYSLALLMPPTKKDFQSLPRDVTFVIDQSGSMQGQSIIQAKQALAMAIEQLKPQDRFNIIAFNNEHQSLFANQVFADDSQRSWAQGFIKNIEAKGGTEMLPALRQALSEQTPHGYVRQVIFLTDGAISNEDQLFNVIANQLGSARLFTVGIGSAPNSYFMRKAAQFGRGSYTYINRVDEVIVKMQTLLEQLQYPALTDIATTWSTAVEHYPERIPDLYLGEPVVLVAKRPNMETTLQVEGLVGQTKWQASVVMPAINEPKQSGLGKLWAREKIASLQDEQITTGQPELHKQSITDLALAQQLMSPYTSFVAVEQKVTRPAEKSIKSKNIPNLQPAGSDQYGYPQTATSWKLVSSW
ncbi:MAG: marine proteobacterial sortase target protein, partial [Enterobacterales bacterium]|nr:marine proteobacterial sortase target protein [Enterobacterales bacterium]